LFLIDVVNGDEILQGVISEWDWTRTSFKSKLRDWPTVEAALSAGRPRVISRSDASKAEAVLFEPSGIASTGCVPLPSRDRRIGVLFFDFDKDVGEGEVDIAFLTDVGERCARALARPARTVSADRAPTPRRGRRTTARSPSDRPLQPRERRRPPR